MFMSCYIGKNVPVVLQRKVIPVVVLQREERPSRAQKLQKEESQCPKRESNSQSLDPESSTVPPRHPDQ